MRNLQTVQFLYLVIVRCCELSVDHKIHNGNHLLWVSQKLLVELATAVIESV